MKRAQRRRMSRITTILVAALLAFALVAAACAVRHPSQSVLGNGDVPVGSSQGYVAAPADGQTPRVQKASGDVLHVSASRKEPSAIVVTAVAHPVTVVVGTLIPTPKPLIRPTEIDPPQRSGTVVRLRVGDQVRIRTSGWYTGPALLSLVSRGGSNPLVKSSSRQVTPGFVEYDAVATGTAKIEVLPAPPPTPTPETGSSNNGAPRPVTVVTAQPTYFVQVQISPGK